MKTRKKDDKNIERQLKDIKLRRKILEKIISVTKKNKKINIMKKLTLFIALFMTVNINAQWTSDTEVNTLVAESLSQDMKAIGTSDGKTYVVFWKSVAPPTNYELRLQLLDASGNRQFGDDGMLISDNIPMSTFTVSWSVAVDANDNLYIGVTGTGDYSGRVFKLDTQGNQLWGANGITLSQAFQVIILPLENGEAIVSWIPGNQALMQKYDANGNPMWASPQAVVSGSSKTAPGSLFELSGGDFLMIFHTYNYGVNSTLYAQRYNTDGAAQWASPIQLSDKTTAYNTKYSGTQDEDTVYFAYKGSHSNRFDSYLQRINPDGTLPWGINGMDFDVNETDFEMDTKTAFFPGSQYVWAICTYANSAQSEYGEYVQKFNKTSGERQFTDNAKMIYAISSDDKVHASDLYLVEDHPLFLLKTGLDNGATPTTLGMLMLDSNGDFVWTEEVKPIATYEANKKETQLTKPVNGQSVAVFVEDKSSGLKIYAQNFVDEAPPAQPALVSPEDGAISIPLATTFSWETAQGAETYHIRIAEEDTFLNPIADESEIENTNFDFTLPEYETTYYWQVAASNSVGDSDWSEVWSFTTELDTGIEEIGTKHELKAYPNPAKDFVFIDINSPKNTEVQVSVFNSIGGKVYSTKENLVKGKTSIKLKIEKLPPATYYYRISGMELECSGKFSK